MLCIQLQLDCDTTVCVCVHVLRCVCVCVGDCIRAKDEISDKKQDKDSNRDQRQNLTGSFSAHIPPVQKVSWKLAW